MGKLTEINDSTKDGAAPSPAAAAACSVDIEQHIPFLVQHGCHLECHRMPRRPRNSEFRSFPCFLPLVPLPQLANLCTLIHKPNPIFHSWPRPPMPLPWPFRCISGSSNQPASIGTGSVFNWLLRRHFQRHGSTHSPSAFSRRSGLAFVFRTTSTAPTRFRSTTSASALFGFDCFRWVFC
jgi:hypothetical protein